MRDNRELQNVILEIYKEFQRICNKYNLKYYAIGGTCIGAIRHNGFIPWDDDMDLAMPIDDYLKFKEIACNELNQNYRLLDYLDTTRFYRNNLFIKIEDIRTTFVEKSEINDVNKYKGVCLDIMPICGCSKDIKKRKKLIFQFYKYIKLNQTKNRSINEMKSVKGKLLWLLTQPIVCFKKDTYYLKKCEDLAKIYTLNESNDVLFIWRIPVRGNYKNCFPYSFFAESTSKNFEDTLIECPIDYDNYLKYDFGNYMKLPPKEKRITHRPILFDLNKSYLEYQKEKLKKEELNNDK